MGAIGETLRESTLRNVQTTSCSTQYFFPHNAVDEPMRTLASILTASKQCKQRSRQEGFAERLEARRQWRNDDLGFESNLFNMPVHGCEEPM